MKNPRLEYFRRALRSIDRNSSDEALSEVLSMLDQQSMYEPELFDIVQVNCGMGEALHGMVLSYDARKKTVSLATTPAATGDQPVRYVAQLGDVRPATPEEARAYLAARGARA